MTFKKAEMAKTLRNGLSMIETNPLSHNWSDFAILSGLTLHQFQKKLLLSSSIHFMYCEYLTELSVEVGGGGGFRKNVPTYYTH